MDNKLAIVFVTNKWRPMERDKFARIIGDCFKTADCYLAIDNNIFSGLTEGLKADNAKIHVFDTESLAQQLGYPFFSHRGIVPGCVHYVLIDFAKQFKYQKYLVIENDVEFTGSWLKPTRLCLETNYDLLAAHFYRHDERPEWIWWNSLYQPDGTRSSKQHLVRAFLPIYCVTYNGLMLLDESHGNGWSGHGEVLIPTLFSMNRLTMSDFNHFGRYYYGSEQDFGSLTKDRTLSTLRWRPPISLAEFRKRFRPDTIYHPIKENWIWTQD